MQLHNVHVRPRASNQPTMPTIYNSTSVLYSHTGLQVFRFTDDSTSNEPLTRFEQASVTIRGYQPSYDADNLQLPSRTQTIRAIQQTNIAGKLQLYITLSRILTYRWSSNFQQPTVPTNSTESRYTEGDTDIRDRQIRHC